MHDLVHDLAFSLLGNKILVESKQGNTRGSSCKDSSKQGNTSPASLIALRFLEGCRIKLSGAAIPHATSLRVLDLSECSIQKLPDSISQLKQLRFLVAPGIQDKMFPECITKLSNLIHLNLHVSKFATLPKSIGELESLMHLDLSNCLGISELPVQFRNLEKLVHLDLSYCSFFISAAPESLCSLSRLEHLNLSGCYRILKFTRGLRGLIELQYLNLSGVNYYGLLEQDLVNMTKLRYLNYRGDVNRDINMVEYDSLLECISGLSNVEYLNLSSNNNLNTIPESIGNLRKLITLDLSECKSLQSLPASMSAINSLKFLIVSGCLELDKSTLPQNNSGLSSLLPNFVVHAGDGKSSSNLSELEDKHPTKLDISRLQNVKSAKQAKRIKLVEKRSIERLELAWTRDAERFVDDREVLEELVPPATLEELTVIGYSSIGFPPWMMSIATYLPDLVSVVLQNLPKCKNLPPLGQLPNLQCLDISGMNSIRKIDGDFYGGRRAFPDIAEFNLSHMDEDGLNELAFPELRNFKIDSCHLLRFNACSPPGDWLSITGSDKVLLSSWENRGHVSASSSAATTELSVACCEAPLHQWSLLRHLPRLRRLEITECSNLTCSSTDLLRCMSSLEILTVEGTVALPRRLGDLTSLWALQVSNCKGIKTLPESIQRLTRLLWLEIDDCPGLVQWCKDNKMKLTHIQEIILDGENLWVMTDEELETLDGEPLCWMTDEELEDDESQYEREASTPQGEVLELTRDFKGLWTNDEKRGASQAGDAANTLKDLPVQQFSLGNCIVITTPGTRRTQRLSRRRGTASPWHRSLLALPPMPHVADPSAAVTSVSASPLQIPLPSASPPVVSPSSPVYSAQYHSQPL